MKTKQEHGDTMKVSRVFLISKWYLFKKLSLFIKTFFLSLLLATSVNAATTTAEDHLSTYNVSIQTARDFIMDNYAANLATVYNVSLEFGVNNDMIAEILANDFPGLKGTVVSSYFDSYGFTGSALGFSTPDADDLQVTYPANSEVLMHFALDNSNSTVDYTPANEQGESKWSGVVDERNFNITLVNDLPTKVTLDDSYATFTYNAYDTVNYKIYAEDNTLLYEKTNVDISTASTTSLNARIIDFVPLKASLEECAQKRLDIALLYESIVFKAKQLKQLTLEDYWFCLDYTSDTEDECKAKNPNIDKSVKDFVLELLIWNRGITVVVNDYKKECVIVEVIDDVLPQLYKPTQEQCESAGGRQFDGECYGDWNIATGVCTLPSIEVWENFIRECGGIPITYKVTQIDYDTNKRNEAYQKCFEDLGYFWGSFWTSISDNNNGDLTAWSLYMDAGTISWTFREEEKHIRCVQ